MHIKNPFRSGKMKSAESGSAWSLQDLVGGSPATVVHHHPRMRFVITAIAVLLITAGVGLVMSDSGLLSTNLLGTGSGSVVKNACNYAAVQGGQANDPCDLVAGLACAPGNQCRCKEGVWNGSRCVVSAATPDVRVRVPDFAQCGPRCSTKYDAVRVSYLALTNDCSTPVQGSETYERDCSCHAEGLEPYADFTQRCEQEKVSPQPSEGTTATCSAPMCASGGSCVCCNGSTAPDCSLSCPGSTGPVSDCSACGATCSLSSDGASCTCGAVTVCPNGATDAPTCNACPIGMIGSVCASAPNACGQRSTGEVLSSCDCSAIAPSDRDCPAAGTTLGKGLQTSIVLDAAGSVTPVRFAPEVKKALYETGHVRFDVDLAFTNISAASVVLSRVAADLDRPFGGMVTKVTGILGNGVVANPAFDGRKDDELLGTGRNTIAPGATAHITLTLTVETSQRELEWELPVSLAVEVPTTGEKMSYDPPPATLGLIKKPTPRPSSSPTADMSSGGPLEFGMLRGTVYRDDNADGQRQDGEKGIAGVKVVVTDGNDIQQQLTTDEKGQYETLVVAGKTSIAVSSDNAVLGSSPRFTSSASYTESFVAPGNIVTIEPVGVARK